jgi:hypothetical protein
MLSIHDRSPIPRDPFIHAGNFPNFHLADTVFEDSLFRACRAPIHNVKFTTAAVTAVGLSRHVPGNRKADPHVPRTLFG